MIDLAEMVRRLRHDREPEYSFNEIEIRNRIEQLQVKLKAQQALIDYQVMLIKDREDAV